MQCSRVSLWATFILGFLLLPMRPVIAQVLPEVGAPTVFNEDYHDTSEPLRDAPQIAPGTHLMQTVPLHHMPVPSISSVTPNSQSASALSPSAVTPLASISNLLTFEGISNRDNLVPPDPNASVGATQVVETVNISYQVFSKTGASILGPSEISSIWAASPPFGGVCQNGPSFSDPIVLYDKIAGRWLIAQIASSNGFSTGTECIAVSTTSDATGSYNRYAFSFAVLNDYPKFGVWPDAYYATYNQFTSSGLPAHLLVHTTAVQCSQVRPQTPYVFRQEALR